MVLCSPFPFSIVFWVMHTNIIDTYWCLYIRWWLPCVTEMGHGWHAALWSASLWTAKQLLYFPFQFGLLKWPFSTESMIGPWRACFSVTFQCYSLLQCYSPFIPLNLCAHFHFDKLLLLTMSENTKYFNWTIFKNFWRKLINKGKLAI